jgi:hypothetical protein
MHVLKLFAYSPTQSLSTRASVLPTQTPLPDLFSPYAKFVQSGIGDEHPEPERGTRVEQKQKMSFNAPMSGYISFDPS